MHVKSAEVRAKLFLLLNTNILEVLSSENNNTSLSNQQGKFVFLHISQFGELQALDLSAHSRSQFSNLKFGVVRIEEVEFVFVGLGSAVDELEWLGWWEFSDLIIDREIAIVFVLRNMRIESMVGGWLTELCCAGSKARLSFKFAVSWSDSWLGISWATEGAMILDSFYCSKVSFANNICSCGRHDI
jgi:hypothetical protein